jgi:diguanylate cyclase (GGDEF)-like protein
MGDKDHMIAQPESPSAPPRAPDPLRTFWLTMGFVLAAWTLLFVLMQRWEHQASEEKYRETVRLKAEMLLENAQALRQWIGGHGGIYVVAGEGVKPNPLLAPMAERDVLTPSGRHLTLYNSPAFLRQVMTEFEALSGSRVHLVSLKPVSPTNHPDEWERAGIARLSPKTDKLAEMTEIDGRPFYRVMSPMLLEKACLTCHQYQASEVGKLIGAVSVSFDATPDLEIHDRAERTLALSHTSMWAIGVALLALGSWRWRQLLLKLEQSALSDPLTGLFNRRELMGRLESEAAATKRYGTGLFLIMLDIDHFKHVNDTYGHQAGDDVLKALAHIMRNTVRINDLLARYGGEEFVIVCPHTGMEEATEIAERVRRSVEQTPLATRAGEIRITISAGVAGYQQGQPVETLIKDADQAMYDAKNSGRNRVCAYASSA